jgi:hypothetical protein
MARQSVLICEPGMVSFRLARTALFEHVFAAFDPDLGIVDLDHVDERLQISLAERNRSGGKILPVCTENLIRVDHVMESPKLAE